MPPLAVAAPLGAGLMSGLGASAAGLGATAAGTAGALSAAGGLGKMLADSGNEQTSTTYGGMQLPQQQDLGLSDLMKTQQEIAAAPSAAEQMVLENSPIFRRY